MRMQGALVRQSAAFITETSLSLSQYHCLRMFVCRVWDKLFGAPVENVRHYMLELCPPSNSFIGKEYFETGSKNKKYELCSYWYHKTPRDELAHKLTSLVSTNKLLSGDDISFFGHTTVLVAFNIDKANVRTSVMLRVLNEKNGNKAENALVIGAMNDNANESHHNLETAFFNSDSHPTKVFLQNLIDDRLIFATIELEDEGGNKLSCCAVVRHKNTAILPPSLVQVVQVTDKKYLTSSIDPPEIATGTDLVLLQDTGSGSAIAMAARKNGTIKAWSTLGHTAINTRNTKLCGAIAWKSIVGYESVDGKMGSSLSGHGGQSSECPCYGCILKQKKMNESQSNVGSKREGQYSDTKLYEVRCDASEKSFATKTARETYLRNSCYGISKKPLLQIPPSKRLYGAMHCMQGNIQHCDQLLFDELTKIDKSSEMQRQATQLEDKLAKNYKQVEAEKQTLDKDLRKKANKLAGLEEVLKNSSVALADRERTAEISALRRSVRALRHDVNTLTQSRKSLLQYIDEIESARSEVELYIAAKATTKKQHRTRRTLAVLVLDDSYFEVCGLTPRKYWGGRTYVFRDALCLAENWEKIEAVFKTKLERITGGAYPAYVEKCIAAIRKTTAIMKLLAPAAIMSKSQRKMDEERGMQFKTLCVSIGIEIRKQYPGVNIWWKLHVTEIHLWEIALLLGFLGIASEEGFEGAHVIMNMIARNLASMKSVELKVQASQNRMKVRNSDEVQKERINFRKQGVKHVNRKKPTMDSTASIPEDEATTREYEIVAAASQNRLAVVKCHRCNCNCPQAAIAFHNMTSHMTSELTLASLGQDVPLPPVQD